MNNVWKKVHDSIADLERRMDASSDSDIKQNVMRAKDLLAGALSKAESAGIPQQGKISKAYTATSDAAASFIRLR